MFAREPDHPAEVRPRRWRFWLTLLGVPLFLAVLALIGWSVSVSGSLRQAIADADALDPGWRLDDVEKARFTPRPGLNAVDRILAAIRLLPANWSNAQQEEMLRDLHPPAL